MSAEEDKGCTDSPRSDGASSETSKVQRKVKNRPSQQQRMLMQMKAQQQLEREQSNVVEASASGALSNQLFKLLRTLFLIFLVGGGLLYYYSPALLNKWLKRKPELPPRSLVSVYPQFMNLKRDLPRFFQSYSIANVENAHARKAVKHIATLREIATNPGSKYHQSINLWPWELHQFRKQLPNADALDQYCGTGSDAIYQSRPELREEILLWCLLATGHDHGFLRYHVQKVYGSVSRGIKGVAVRYDGHPNRAMARSLLLLPFHKTEDLRRGQPLPPSTRVATNTMLWFRQNAPLITDFEELMAAMEEFLFRSIQKEQASWHWMYAACTVEERAARKWDPRVASMCTEDEEASGMDCCVIFDPDLHAFYGRSRR